MAHRLAVTGQFDVTNTRTSKRETLFIVTEYGISPGGYGGADTEVEIAKHILTRDKQPIRKEDDGSYVHVLTGERFTSNDPRAI